MCLAGMGRPKAGGLGQEMGQGHEATVALGRMEFRVNTRFCFRFISNQFQISFEFSSNSIDFDSSLRF
jgi:hypothetical protein